MKTKLKSILAATLCAAGMLGAGSASADAWAVCRNVAYPPLEV